MIKKFKKAKDTFGLKVELDDGLNFEKALRLFTIYLCKNLTDLV